MHGLFPTERVAVQFRQYESTVVSIDGDGIVAVATDARDTIDTDRL